MLRICSLLSSIFLKCSRIFDLEPLAKFFEVFPSDLLNNVKGNNSGYIVNQLSEKLIDQYEARITQCEAITAEKDAALTKQDAIINELRERLEKYSK